MISPRQLQILMASDAANRTEHLLAKLGWQGASSISRPPDSPNGYGRLRLDGDLTTIGCPLADDTADAWWTGFLQGARYHVALSNTGLLWHDFHEARSWQSSDLNSISRACDALSPDAFTLAGTFKPAADAAPNPQLPTRQPRDFLMDVIRNWWHTYLGEEMGPDQNGFLLQSEFVNLVAKLVFVRTIEDRCGGAQDILPFSLQDLASKPAPHVELERLFKVLQPRLGSEIFRQPGLSLPPQGFRNTRQLLQALYRENERPLDFAALDFSMVGRFYEVVLGDHASLEEDRQLRLVGQHQRTVKPVSHRRETGQYYTPRTFSDYIARRVVLPRVRAAQTVGELPVIADIAVGSGELLTAALRAILSVPRFRTPEAVRTILTSHLIGVDINPVAIQLTQLNLLRTAYLATPELVENLPLPDIQHIATRDSLFPRAFRKLPRPDVLLMNPPFRGQPDWLAELPEKRPSELDLLTGNNDRASAFLLRGLKWLKDGGSLGIVMPNQFFTAPGEENVRAAVARSFVVTEVLNNRGALVFDGVKIQPGILFGRKAPAVRPRVASVMTVRPPRSQQRAIADTGVAGFSHFERDTVPTPTSSDWLFDSTAYRSRFSIALTTAFALSGGEPIRAPMTGIGSLLTPWTLKRLDANRFRHELSNQALTISDDDLRFIYRAVRAKDLSRAKQAFSPPLLGDDYVFYPHAASPDGGSITLTLDEWVRRAPSLAPMFQAVVSAARGTRKERKQSQEDYRRSLAEGKLKFYRHSSFDPTKPFMLLSRMAQLEYGREAISGWIFSPADRVVPVSGNYFHVSAVERALAFLAFMNSSEVFYQLRRTAPTRGPTSAEITSGLLRDLLVPDLEHLDPFKAQELLRTSDLVSLGRLADEIWDSVRVERS